MASGGTSPQDSFGFIDDGYNVERFVRGVPRLHPEVLFTARIVTPDERGQWAAEVARVQEEDRTHVTARWISERIVKWSLPRPPQPENVLKLVPELYDKVFAVVFGNSAGDPLPGEKRPAAADRAADLKNSHSG